MKLRISYTVEVTRAELTALTRRATEIGLSANTDAALVRRLLQEMGRQELANVAAACQK